MTSLLSQIKLSKDQLVQVNPNLYVFKGSIQLHRDLYETQGEKMVSRLRSILGRNTEGVFARKTKVVQVEKPIAEAFLNANHMLGFVSGRHFLSLQDTKGRIVALASFSQIRNMKYENPPYDSVELIRYCSLAGVTVVGGLDKLIKGYLKAHRVDDIVTTIDLEWSRGESFSKLGFEVVKETSPLSFRITKSNWKRELIEDGMELTEHHYAVQNQGNLKMRRLTSAW